MEQKIECPNCDQLKAERDAALRALRGEVGDQDDPGELGVYKNTLADENQKLREDNTQFKHLHDEYVALRVSEAKLTERVAKLRLALCEIGTESGAYSNTILRARAALTQDSLAANTTQDDEMEKKG